MDKAMVERVLETKTKNPVSKDSSSCKSANTKRSRALTCSNAIRRPESPFAGRAAELERPLSRCNAVHKQASPFAGMLTKEQLERLGAKMPHSMGGTLAPPKEAVKPLKKPREAKFKEDL